MKKKIVTVAVALALTLGVANTALAGCCGGGYGRGTGGMGYGMMYNTEGALLSEEDFTARLDLLISEGLLSETDRAYCMENYAFIAENGGTGAGYGGRGMGFCW